MKNIIRNLVLIISGMVSFFVLLHMIVLDNSISEAQLSFKTLVPLFSYNRQKSIKHLDFNPITIHQKRTSNLDLNQRLLQLVKAVETDDNSVIDAIKNYIIYPPAKGNYLLNDSDLYDYSGGQSAIVDNNLRFKEKGFYIECCDTDGEKDSTSLFFERVRKWNGLVMTADPKKFSKLLQKNRRALTMNACLSQSFRVEKKARTVDGKLTDVFCFPLHAIMSAIQRPSINLFALDVDGERELSILKALPFDKVNIEMMTVRFRGEIRHFKSGVQLYMESNGYETVLKLIKETDDSVHHLILKKKGPNFIVTLIRMVGAVFLVVILGATLLFNLTKCVKRRQTYN